MGQNPTVVCRRFIGRREELALLHARRREASASRGGIVLVRGDAGVGKTRMLGEFSASLRKSRCRSAEATCHQFVQRPFGPILEIVDRLAPAASARGPVESRHERFEAIVATLADSATRRPVVAMIDDLHWADLATLEALAYLAPRVKTMRILIIASLRSDEPQLQAASASAIGRLSASPLVARVDLGPLNPAELRDFMDDALGSAVLPPESRRAVARAGEGNPFFTEELLRAAVERRGQPALRIAATLPASVQSVLIERVRPLSIEDRRVLAQAAVVGRTFDTGVLADTLDVAEAEILDSLRRARDLQVVAENGDGTFGFRHALTREAIYGDFLEAQLRPLHRRIALALERRADAPVGELGYHWWAAGDRARAARYNELAGDAAVRQFANEDAIAAFDRALSAVDDDLARARIWEKSARSHRAIGMLQASIRRFDWAAEGAHFRGDIAQEAALRIDAAETRHIAGDDDPSLDLRAMLAGLPAADHAVRTQLHLAIAVLHGLRYQLADARRHLLAADPTVAAGSAQLGWHHRVARTMIAMMEGDVDSLRDACARLASEAAERYPSAEAYAEADAAFYLAGLGDHDVARAAGRRAVERAGQRRDFQALAFARGASAYAALISGDLAAARDDLRAMPEPGRDDQLSMIHAAAWGSLVGSLVGDDDLITRSFDRLAEAVSPVGAFLYAAGYAEILAQRRRLPEARALLRRALQFGEMPRGMIFTLLAAARYCDDDDAAFARTRMTALGGDDERRMEAAALPLFDALRAAKHGAAEEARALAAASVAPLRRLRLPLLEALALEVSGDVAGALAVFRTTGAWAHVHRLERAAGLGRAQAADVPPSSALSAREREVAAAVARGASNAEIGAALSISVKTVEKHVGSVFRKLGFTSRAQLAAYSAGLAEPTAL